MLTCVLQAGHRMESRILLHSWIVIGMPTLSVHSSPQLQRRLMVVPFTKALPPIHLSWPTHPGRRDDLYVLVVRKGIADLAPPFIVRLSAAGHAVDDGVVGGFQGFYHWTLPLYAYRTGGRHDTRRQPQKDGCAEQAESIDSSEFTHAAAIISATA